MIESHVFVKGTCALAVSHVDIARSAEIGMFVQFALKDTLLYFMTILSSIILTVTTPENVNLANSESTIKSTILQVMLHHSSSNTEVLVYALLNTQSNTNFVT